MKTWNLALTGREIITIAIALAQYKRRNGTTDHIDSIEAKFKAEAQRIHNLED
jgi:hypothetical protein